MVTVNAQQYGNVQRASVCHSLLSNAKIKNGQGSGRFATVAVAACCRTRLREMDHINRSGRHIVRGNVLQTCKHCRETCHNRTTAKNRAFADHIQPTQCSHGWLAWRAGRGTYRASACVYLRIELLQAHTTTQNACDGCLQPKTASEYLSTALRPNGTASSKRSGRRPTNPTMNSEPAMHSKPFQTDPMNHMGARTHQPASEASGLLLWAVNHTTGADWGVGGRSEQSSAQRKKHDGRHWWGRAGVPKGGEYAYPGVPYLASVLTA
jgi:hypothetical protein